MDDQKRDDNSTAADERLILYADKASDDELSDEELSDSELSDVSGGRGPKPQPLPYEPYDEV